MTTETNANPGFPVAGVSNYDPVGHQADVVLRMVNVQTDTSVTPNVVYGDLAVDVEVTAQAPTSSTGTKSKVAGSASSVTLLAANSARKGAVIYNDSTAVLYLDLSGGTATSSNYSVQIGAQGYFELPGPAIYTGAITGVWASANGNAYITEFS